jgi:hypothetical protein
MLPPDPLVIESPDRTRIDPLLPELLSPVWNANAPLTPDEPESAVRRLKAPLDFEVLEPLTIDTLPPVAPPEPADIAMRPPAP